MKGTESQVKVISNMYIIRCEQLSFQGVYKAVRSFQRLCNKGIGTGNLSVLGCLWSLGTLRCG